jgi:GH15 family glucan-1,4-alpha-glucosidase
VSARLEDYALLSDCSTAALVSRSGSLDWLCWPRFDSNACCAALLGEAKHGRWLLAAQDPSAQSTRSYRRDTLILETQFATSDGVATITDFMPMHRDGSHIVRLVTGKRGRVAMRFELVLRFDYGALVPWVTRLADGRISYVAGPHRLVLQTPVPVQGVQLRTVGEFRTTPGQCLAFVLSYAASARRVPARIRPTSALRATERFWRNWVSHQPRTAYRDAVTRSCITLKALTHRHTGGIIAAPTTSLPEQLGGSRNWDYRYCWVRDATLTLQALMKAGYYHEARLWRGWLLRAAAGDPAKLQIMYGIAGERLLPESVIDSLPGYEHSRPVRIGNAASEQAQLDVYGELIDVLHQGRLGKLAGSQAGWQLQRGLLKHLESIWTKADHGIWEMRSRPRHFTYSKVMVWVAVDRMIKSAEQFGLEAPLQRWRGLRADIRADVCRHGFNSKMGSFVQSYGSNVVDASLLRLPLVGFLPITDARVRGTVRAIERHLVVDGLVKRYSTGNRSDGLRGSEGVFLACSFWLADNLTLLKRRREARELFERLLTLRTDLGLLSEEYDPRLKRLVGNFPQSFSHIALINSAFNLSGKGTLVGA